MADSGGGGAGDFGDFAEELLRDAPCGIAVSDHEGRTLFLNATLIAWLDAGGEAPPPDVVEDMFTPPGRIYFQTHVLPMMQLQGFVREIALHLRRPRRPDLSVLLNGVLRRDRAGKPRRIDWMMFDATERGLYESQLRSARREAEELAAIVRSSPNPILRVDGEGRVENWNAAAARLTGITSAEAAGRAVEEVLALDNGAAAWFRDAAEAFDAGAAIETRDVTHVSGREFELTLSPIGPRGPDGARPDFSVVLRDITARKLAEAHLGLVIDELNHRVKNTLGVVLGIARQTLPSEVSQAFGERVQSLTRAHNLLTEARWDSIEIAQLFEVTQGQAGGAERLRYSADPVSLSPRHATSMSMALHELVTNAIKYGALSSPAGQVRLSCRQTGEAGAPRLHMEWRETGGPVVTPPEDSGFGSKMINRILAAEFNAEVDFDFRPEGLCCTIDCPLPPPE